MNPLNYHYLLVKSIDNFHPFIFRSETPFPPWINFDFCKEYEMISPGAVKNWGYLYLNRSMMEVFRGNWIDLIRYLQMNGYRKIYKTLLETI